MRRNSGDDQGRDRLLDPTMKEHEAERGKSGAAVIDREAHKDGVDDDQRTTGMGSDARKTGSDDDTG